MIPIGCFGPPRLLSALAGSLSLIVFFHIFVEATGNRMFSLAVVSCISFIPMYSYMASGTHHCTFLVLLSALAILYWVRFTKSHRCQSAVAAAAFLSVAATVKITALALAVPMLSTICWHLLNRRAAQVWWKIAMLASIAAFLPGLWLLKNWLVHGDPLIDNAALRSRSQPILDTGVVEFLSVSHPVFNGLFNFFWGVFGWNGDGTGAVRFLMLSSVAIQFYTAVGWIVALGALVWYFQINRRRGVLQVGSLVLIVLTMGTLIYAVVFHNSPLPLYRSLLYVCVLSTLILSALTFAETKSISASLAYNALLVVTFFTLAFLLRMKENYEMLHHLGGFHGRYFFPLIPMLVMAYVYPAYRAISPRTWLLLGGCLAMGVSEIRVFALRVVPYFYRVGNIYDLR